MELVAIFSKDRNECLEHYGVPGMKWGKWNEETARKHGIGVGTRRKRTVENRKGNVSKRTMRRLSKMADKPAGEHATKVLDSMNKELSKSKEGKAYNKMLSERGRINTQTGSTFFSYYDKPRTKTELKRQIAEDRRTMNNQIRKRQQIYAKYEDALAEASLKDFNYEVTEKGKAAVKKILSER